jgi:hypothetical protein
VRAEGLEETGGGRVAPAHVPLDPAVGPAAAAHPHHDAVEDVLLRHLKHVLEEPERPAVPGQYRNAGSDTLVGDRELVIGIHKATLVTSVRSR